MTMQTCDWMTCETKSAFLGGFPGRWTDDPGHLMDTASCEEEELPALKVRVEVPKEVESHVGVLTDPV